MYCKKCGAELPLDAAFCESCGTKVNADAAPVAPAQSQVYRPAAQTQEYRETAPQKKKSGAKIFIILIIAVILLAAAAVAVLFITGAIGKEEPHAPMAEAVAEEAETVTEPVTETVTDQQMTLTFDSYTADGIYTGAVDESGLPHGSGRFETQADGDGDAWSYQGMWKHGRIAGQGEMVMEDGWIDCGEFLDGNLNGFGTTEQNGVIRYEGEWKNGELEGRGKLYTASGILLYEGNFKESMLGETEEARQQRAAAFMEDCTDMDGMFYAACKDGRDVLNTPLALWGEVTGMSDQTTTGLIIINLFGDEDYLVALRYRYGVDERRITGDEGSISAWGYFTGEQEFTAEGGESYSAPLVELVYWTAE